MLSPTALVALICLAQSPRPAVARAAEELVVRRDAIRAREAEALGGLAGKLDGESAARVKGLIDPPPDADGSTRFVPLPETLPKAEPASPPGLMAIRLEAAKAYFDLASRALKADPPRLALADESLRAVVVRDPGHAEAHRLLGYIPHEGGWITPFAAQQTKQGLVLHPIFGWVAKEWVPHLDRGELPAPFKPGQPTRWLPVDEADSLRRQFADGWRITTEHFQIRTNVPLREAIAFGRHLEAMHGLFFSIMADLVGPDLPLAQLAKNAKLAPTPPKKSHRVFYFADKGEYVEFLGRIHGLGFENSLGVYLPKKEMKGLDGVGTSFFYRDPGGQLDVTETLYHEVSHQLLFESAGEDKYDPKRSHFWVFEGLGTYFETLRPQPDGSIRIGGLVGKRIEVAQQRLIKENEFIPIGRIDSYNKPLFNGETGGDVYLNYAESIALAVFFMQAHSGQYREGFLDYARDVYKGRLRDEKGKSLEDRLGIPFGQLARDFLDYIRPRSDPAAAQIGGR